MASFQSFYQRAFILDNLRESNGEASWRVNVQALHKNLRDLFNFPYSQDDTSVSYNGPALFVAGEKSAFLRYVNTAWEKCSNAFHDYSFPLQTGPYALRLSLFPEGQASRNPRCGALGKCRRTWTTHGRHHWVFQAVKLISSHHVLERSITTDVRKHVVFSAWVAFLRFFFVAIE